MNKRSRLVVYLALCCGISHSQAIAQQDPSCPHGTQTSLIDVPRFLTAIQSGRVYQHLDFLSPGEVDTVWNEINQLEAQGGFSRSGLSNTAQGSGQQFGAQDRTLCPVPWWPTSLSGDQIDNASLQPIAVRIQELRHILASLLERPTMADSSLSHECYYSMSKIGSFLPRHMDERHEELKGAKGWLLPSRRSLSWLIYLSDPSNWDLDRNGGALRSFPPKPMDTKYQVTQDDGNLQIGWLLDEKNKRKPVFMDSWFPLGKPPEPHCVLYTREKGERIFLTQPWLTESIQGMSVPDFISMWAHRQSDSDDQGLFLRSEDAKQFALIEDRPAWDSGQIPEGSEVEDIAPLRGSLVVFDSVLLPHQVELIKDGRRVALAGWFHEATQPFPEGLYS